MYCTSLFCLGMLLAIPGETAVSLWWHGGVPWSNFADTAGTMFFIACVATGSERSRRRGGRMVR